VLNNLIGMKSWSARWLHSGTRGYEATSIDDLVQAKGMGRGSLYGTFGDKRQLFLAALDHYWKTVGMEMFAELSDPDARQAIERMFDALVPGASNPKMSVRLPFH
jgi:TetR/AcrR family transcriptional regulator, transcriptional repressor for nem operon